MATNTITTERGAVALITAMIVSILLMITTAGMVSLTTKSLRQSTDGAQSAKAYYAAEGGLEEVLLKLRTDPNYRGDCDGSTSADSAVDGAVTCSRVVPTANQVEGILDAGETDQIDLSAVPAFSEVTLEWSGLSDTANGFKLIPNYVAQGFPGGQQTAAPVKWPVNAPPVMELGVVEYPNAQTFTIEDVRFRQGVVAPKGNGQSDPTRTLESEEYYSYKTDTESSQNKPHIGTCSLSAVYHCKIVAGNFNRDVRNKYVLRLKSRYNGAKYKITVSNAGRPVVIPGTVYTIDVTARAGNTFRRIRTSLPIDGTVSSEGLSGLDYVLYSDTDICKSFMIKDNKAQDLVRGAGMSCLPN